MVERGSISDVRLWSVMRVAKMLCCIESNYCLI